MGSNKVYCARIVCFVLFNFPFPFLVLSFAHPEVLFDLYWDMHLYGLTTLLVFVVSVACTAHTCSVCTSTTCVHISVPSNVRAWYVRA